MIDIGIIPVSEARFGPTIDGYVLIMKVFTFGLWFECRSKLLLFDTIKGPQTLEIELSKLCLQNVTQGESLHVINCWASTYGEEFQDITVHSFNEFMDNTMTKNDMTIDDLEKGTIVN